MRPNKKFQINSKNGVYLGDLCYALDDKVYHGEWGDKYGFEDGAYKDDETGLEFAMVGTSYGDGCYPGSDGNDYPVDAGIIGVCDINLATKDEAKRLGTFLPHWKGIVTIEFYNGDIIAKYGDERIVIETGD